MKRWIALLLAIISVMLCLAACGGDDKKEETKEEEEEIAVDYTDIAKFKADLEAGEAMAGKTLTFKVEEIDTGSMYGTLIKCSELCFEITDADDVKVGDELTVMVTNTRMALNVRYIACYIVE